MQKPIKLCPPDNFSSQRRRILSFSEITDYSMAKSGRSSASQRSKYCQNTTLTKSQLFESINGTKSPESRAKKEMDDRNLE